MQKQNNEIRFPVVRFLSLLIFLSAFFLPAQAVFVTDAEARMGREEAEIRYLLRRKFMLSGELSATYDQISTKTGDSPEISRYSLAEELRLNFKSYVYHPAILTYTAELDLLNSSGDYGRGNVRSGALGLDFFRRKPLKFSLRAGYTDATDYTLNSQGFSVSYTRTRQQLSFGSMREASRYMAIQRYIQEKAEKQTSKNTPDDEDEDSSNNSQSNSKDNVQKNDQADLPNIKSSRGLNFFDNIAPRHILLDVDRNAYKSSFGASNNIESYFTSLRFIGTFLTANTTTNYNLNLAYQNINEKADGDLQEKYRADFNLRTGFKDSSRFILDTRYRIEDSLRYSTKDLYSTARYEGFFKNKKWNYTVAAIYDWTEVNTHTSSRYLFSAAAQSSMNYGRVQVTHLIGLKYDHGNQDSNYAVFGREQAALPVNDRLTVGGGVGFDIGSSARAFDAGVNSRYQLSRRSFLTASYNYANFSGNRVSSDSFISSSLSSSSTSHAFRLGYTAVFDKFSFDSAVQYNIYDKGNSLVWNNLFNTILFNRVSFSLGASLTRENAGVPSGDFGLTNVQPGTSGDGTSTSMSLYNTIAVSPFRNALFRVYSAYQKRLNGVKSEAYNTNPNFQWRLRKLYMSLDYKYAVETQEALKTREQRLLFRVSRPFWL